MDTPIPSDSELHVKEKFNTWWKRKFGIDVYYLCEEGRVRVGLLTLCSNDVLILQLSHGCYSGDKYLVNNDGTCTEQIKISYHEVKPIRRWWFK